MNIGITFKELTEVPFKKNETKNQLVDLIRSEADIPQLSISFKSYMGFKI